MGPFSTHLGKVLIIAGLAVVILGVLLVIGPKIPGIGRLPGDILIRRENVTFYFPVVTSLLISLVLTILLNLLFR
jgi:hypothetical protein